MRSDRVRSITDSGKSKLYPSRPWKAGMYAKEVDGGQRTVLSFTVGLICAKAFAKHCGGKSLDRLVRADSLFMILASNILLRITHRSFRALTSTCRSSTMAAANAAADALDPNRGSKNTLKLENVRTS